MTREGDARVEERESDDRGGPIVELAFLSDDVLGAARHWFN